MEPALAVDEIPIEADDPIIGSEEFGNQRSLGSELYRRLAEENGLDVAALESCMGDGERLAEIEADAAAAAALGISGTPSFLVGRLEDGRLVEIDTLVGAQPYAAFAELLDAKL